MSDRPIADPDIRAVLKSRLQAKHALEPDTVVVEELGLCQGQVRVDMAVVNGVLHGYEIKSDCDTLRRLPNQVVAYGKVLDRATLVVGVRQCGRQPTHHVLLAQPVANRIVGVGLMVAIRVIGLRQPVERIVGVVDRDVRRQALAARDDHSSRSIARQGKQS